MTRVREGCRDRSGYIRRDDFRASAKADGILIPEDRVRSSTWPYLFRDGAKASRFSRGFRADRAITRTRDADARRRGTKRGPRIRPRNKETRIPPCPFMPRQDRSLILRGRSRATSTRARLPRFNVDPAAGNTESMSVL